MKAAGFLLGIVFAVGMAGAALSWQHHEWGNACIYLGLAGIALVACYSLEDDSHHVSTGQTESTPIRQAARRPPIS